MNHNNNENVKYDASVSLFVIPKYLRTLHDLLFTQIDFIETINYQSMNKIYGNSNAK